MHSDPFVSSIVLIFTGAALLATLALYARQALLVAYIVLGVLFGPWGANVVEDPEVFQRMAHVGIIFLLFLLGLDLDPKELIKKLGEATFVTAVSSASFAIIGFGVAWMLGLNLRECLVVGAAAMFSSTVIGVKLLPTTTLHHQRKGEIMISVLLLQDLIAVLVLLLLEGYGASENVLAGIGTLIILLPVLIAAVWYAARFVLIQLIERFDTIHEYVFLVTLGWCLGIAHLASLLGYSHEIGAFLAGVALAQSPIALFIIQNLKPVRDFFLVVFFFSIGASFDLQQVGEILFPAALLAALLLSLKPMIFRTLLIRRGEAPPLAAEIGFRLGQASEFALLIALLAANSGFIGERASYLIQITVLLTFVISSAWIVMRYPTPMAVSDDLRRD